MVTRSTYVVVRSKMRYTGNKSVAELRQAQVVYAQADNDNNKEEK